MLAHRQDYHRARISAFCVGPEMVTLKDLEKFVRCQISKYKKWSRLEYVKRNMGPKYKQYKAHAKCSLFVEYIINTMNLKLHPFATQIKSSDLYLISFIALDADKATHHRLDNYAHVFFLQGNKILHTFEAWSVFYPQNPNQILAQRRKTVLKYTRKKDFTKLAAQFLIKLVAIHRDDGYDLVKRKDFNSYFSEKDLIIHRITAS